MFTPSILCGRSHTILITDSNRLLGWGDNASLALGVDNPRDALDQSKCLISYPNMSVGPKRVAVGEDYTLVLDGGRLVSFGKSKDGQLGHNSSCAQVSFPHGARVGQIAAGFGFSIAVDVNQIDMYAWGRGQAQSLGIVAPTSRPVRFRLPKPMDGRHRRVVSVSIGSEFSSALCDDGRVYTWGLGSNGRLGHGDLKSVSQPRLIQTLMFDNDARVVQVAAGAAHALALTRAGRVYAWGAGSHGRLGLGSESDSPVPSLVRDLPKGVTWVACSFRHSLAVTRPTKDGVTLWTWGSGRFGKLGTGDSTVERNVLTPEPVTAFVDFKPQFTVLEAACGPRHTVAVAARVVRSRGKAAQSNEKRLFKVFAWGSSDRQLCGRPIMDDDDDESAHNASLHASGQGSSSKPRWITVPSVVFDDTKQRDRAFLRARIAALDAKMGTSDGGSSEKKQFGIAVAAGAAHSLAVTKENELYAWGDNSSGQLGIGPIPRALSPSRVRFPFLHAIVRLVACGDHHSLAICGAGNLFSWGSNQNGQLGLGDCKDRRTPCIVEALQGARVAKAAAGGQHSGAVVVVPADERNLSRSRVADAWQGSDSGEIVQFHLWGQNDRGQVGIDVSSGSGPGSGPAKLNADVHRVTVPRRVHIPESRQIDGYDISLGTRHSMLLLRRTPVGAAGGYKMSWLYVCGDNDHSQLGLQECNRGAFQSVPALLDKSSFGDMELTNDTGFESTTTTQHQSPNIRLIAAGATCSLAVVINESHKDDLYAWGQTHGLASREMARPRRVKEFESHVQRHCLSELEPGDDTWLHHLRFENLSAGSTHSMAIVTVNESRRHLFVWGDSSFGKLGIGNVIDAMKRQNQKQSKEFGEAHARSLAGQDKGTSSDSKVSTLGGIGIKPQLVSTTQLLRGTSTALVDAFKDCSATAVGSSHSLSVNSESGHVFAWGCVDGGRLGIGEIETTTRIAPVAVSLFEPRTTLFDDDDDARPQSRERSTGGELRGNGALFFRRSPSHDGTSPSNGAGQDTKVPPVDHAEISDDEASVDGGVSAHTRSDLGAENPEGFLTQEQETASVRRRIQNFHTLFVTNFRGACALFDEREGLTRKARHAIAARMEAQRQSWTRLDALSTENTSIFKTHCMSPQEEILTSMYLDPSRLAALFRVLHREYGHKPSQPDPVSSHSPPRSRRMPTVGAPDGKDSGSDDTDAEAAMRASTDKNRDAKRPKVKTGPTRSRDTCDVGRLEATERAFLELVFAVFDLAVPASRRRFQVFFRMVLDYILNPTESAEVTTDLFHKNTLAWHLLKGAMLRGLSRATVASTMAKLLCDPLLSYEQFKNEGVRSICGVFTSEDKLSYADTLLQLKSRARRLLGLMTSESHSKGRTYTKELLQGADGSGGCEWLLHVALNSINRRASAMLKDARVRSRSLDERLVTTWKNAIAERFCRAIIQSIACVALETTAIRWASRTCLAQETTRMSASAQSSSRQLPRMRKSSGESNIGTKGIGVAHGAASIAANVLGIRNGAFMGGMDFETEIFVLHMIAGSRELLRYIQARASGPWIPRGATLDDVETWDSTIATTAGSAAADSKRGARSPEHTLPYRVENPLDIVRQVGDFAAIGSAESNDRKAKPERNWVTDQTLPELDEKNAPKRLKRQILQLTPKLSSYMKIVSRRVNRHRTHLKGLVRGLLQEAISLRMTPQITWASLSPRAQTFITTYCRHPKLTRNPLLVSRATAGWCCLRIVPFYMARTRRMRWNAQCLLWHPTLRQVLADKKLRLAGNQAELLAATATSSPFAPSQAGIAAMSTPGRGADSRLFDDALRKNLSLLATRDIPRNEAVSLAASAVKRWVAQHGGRIKLHEMGRDFGMGSHVADPAALYKRVANVWLRVAAAERQNDDLTKQVNIGPEDCFLVFAALKEKSFQDLFARRAGEGVWKEVFRLLRRRRDQSRSGRERFERAINALMAIKTIAPSEDKEIVLAREFRIRADMLDVSQLYVLLRDIEASRGVNRRMLDMSLSVYDDILHDQSARGGINIEIRDLERIYKDITGPVTAAETAKRRAWLEHRKTVQDATVTERGSVFSRSPLYDPKPISVVQETGTVRTLTYAELRDSGVLLRPHYDPSGPLLDLTCSQFLLEVCFTGTKEADAVFLHNLSFLFLSTGKQDAFLVQLLYEKTTILRRTEVSMSSLRHHVQATTAARRGDGADDMERFGLGTTADTKREKRSQSMGLGLGSLVLEGTRALLARSRGQSGGASRDTNSHDGAITTQPGGTQYSFMDLTTEDDDSALDRVFTLDAGDDASKHAAFSRAGKQHIYNNGLYLFFDPIGSVSPRKARCVFIFDAPRLLDFLAALPKPPAGFIDKVDVQDPRHFPVLTHRYTKTDGLTDIFN